MRTYSNDALAALSSGAIVKRRLLKFEFDETYAFWDGIEDFTPVDGAGGAVVDPGADGVTFAAGGSVFEISLQSQSIDDAEPRLSVILRATDNDPLPSQVPLTIDGDPVTIDGSTITVPGPLDLTPTVLATIFQESYHKKRVSLFRAIFDSSTGALIEVALRFRGRLDQITYVEEPGSEAGRTYLEASIVSRLIEWNRAGAHDRNDASQRVTFPLDKGLTNIEQTSKIRKWASGVTQQ